MSDGICVRFGAITPVKHSNAGSAMSALRCYPDDVSAED